MISNFEQLIQTANTQKDAQRLLMLFANAETENNKGKDQHKGTISPVMCVDKLPSEISTFENLAKEADNINKDWNFVLIAGLNGKGDTPPSTEEADQYLNQMVNDVTSGQDLSRYVIFDREKNPIMMQA